MHTWMDGWMLCGFFPHPPSRLFVPSLRCFRCNDQIRAVRTAIQVRDKLAAINVQAARLRKRHRRSHSNSAPPADHRARVLSAASAASSPTTPSDPAVQHRRRGSSDQTGASSSLVSSSSSSSSSPPPADRPDVEAKIGVTTGKVRGAELARREEGPTGVQIAD